MIIDLVCTKGLTKSIIITPVTQNPSKDYLLRDFVE